MEEVMKIISRAVFVAGVVMALAAVAAAQPAGTETDRQNVQLTFEKYIQTVKTADVGLAAQVWSHSDDIVVITPFGRFQGWNSVRENLYVNFLQKAFTERTLQPSNLVIRVAGDTAWSAFDWTFTGKTQDGRTVTSKGWESHVYQRTPEGWAIAALHYSVPPPQQ
jgi:ketosteroid isomerase-like protein